MFLPDVEFLLLRIGGFVVLLTEPDHDADGVVLQHPADGVRTRAHHDGVAHVVGEPVVDAALDVAFAVGEFNALG